MIGRDDRISLVDELGPGLSTGAAGRPFTLPMQANDACPKRVSRPALPPTGSRLAERT